jgi:hypothetical protein
VMAIHVGGLHHRRTRRWTAGAVGAAECACLRRKWSAGMLLTYDFRTRPFFPIPQFVAFVFKGFLPKP